MSWRRLWFPISRWSRSHETLETSTKDLQINAIGGIDASMAAVLENTSMKQLTKLALASGLTAIGLVACNTSNGPTDFGTTDPLRAPGSGTDSTSIDTEGFSAGQFVRAAVDNTAFYLKRPKGAVDADKLLRRGTSMKVISTSGDYLKVELDSGEVGFVPPVMVEDAAGASSSTETLPSNPNEIQLYPPLPGSTQPLPPGAPGEQPPAGAIPTVIDPDAPSPASAPPIAAPDQTPPNPPAPTAPDANAANTAPATPATTTANSKELEEMKKKAEALAPKEGEAPPAQ
jgi:hypothetical protein